MEPLELADFDDSRASTAASVSDLQDEAELSGAARKAAACGAPTDFAFMRRLPPAKKPRRVASPMHRYRKPPTLPPEQPNVPAAGKNLEVCGPELIQTLRGRLFGREAAIVFCGEAHEDAIDLTRRNGILAPAMGWLPLPPARAPVDPDSALAKKMGLTMEGAKEWAEEVLERLEEKDQESNGAILVFSSSGGTRGLAALYPPGLKCEHNQQHRQLRGMAVFEWGDADEQAREFNRRRLSSKGVPMPVEEQDALISERKSACLEDGLELFDDWLIRTATNSEVRVEFVQEAPVSAHDVELHEEPGVGPAPMAHESLRRLELDGEEDAEQRSVPGNGSFLDYLRRQVMAHMPLERVHFVDPRMLGDAEDDSLPEAFRGSFETWVSSSTKSEEALQEELDAPPKPLRRRAAAPLARAASLEDAGD